MNIYGAILGLGIALTAIGLIGSAVLGVAKSEHRDVTARPLALTIPALIIGATLIGATAEQASA